MTIQPSSRFRRGVLMLFLFLYWASGGAMLALGSVILVDSRRQLLFFLVHIDGSPTFRLLCVCLVLVGSIKLLAVVLGCLGTLKKDACMSGFYLFLMAATMCAEILLGVFSSIHQQNTNEALALSMGRKLAKYYGVPGHETETVAIDYAQYTFQCCGVQSPADYDFSRWRVDEMGGEQLSVPLTCCALRHGSRRPYLNPRPRDMRTCQQSRPAVYSAERYTRGCLQDVSDWLARESTMLTSLSLSIAFIDMLCIATLLCWYRRVIAASDIQRHSPQLAL